MHRGYIKLYRKSEENLLYFSEVFTKWQAWTDLVLIANHSKKTLSIRGNIISIKRGQTAYSEESLAQRWKWSRGKVRRFINYLKTEQQIEQQQSNILNILTIKNYNIYHGNDTTDGTTDGQQTVQQTDTNNNDNNDKNDKKRDRICKFIPPNIEDVKKYITENKYQVNPEAFIKYYTESNWVDANGKKVKNWKQKIITWAGRNNKKIVNPGISLTLDSLNKFIGKERFK